MSWDGRALLEHLGVDIVRNDQFTCHYDDFASWANGRKSFKMEDFYRWQRSRLELMMDGASEPAGGRWNFDHDNRERPPKDGRSWPTIAPFALDDIDRSVINAFGDNVWGAPPDGHWPVTRDPGAPTARRVHHDRACPVWPSRRRHVVGRMEDGALGVGVVHEPWLVAPHGSRRSSRGGLSLWRRADQLGRGFHPPGDRLARVRLGRLLVVDARVPRREPIGGHPRRAEGFTGEARPTWRASET